MNYFNKSNISGVLQLGDIVDGHEQDEKLDIRRTHVDLERVLKRLSPIKAPIYHALGNHCLLADIDCLFRRLNLEKPGYYFRDLSPLWRLVILDTVEISVWRKKHQELQRQASQYLKDHAGEPNAQRWNGGLGKDQIDWMHNILDSTKREGKFAVVCGHIPVVAEAAVPGGVVYSSHYVEKQLSRHTGCVKAYFSGHYHAGGYAYRCGIHHVTFEGLLDADHHDGAFGIVELHRNKIVINGEGTMTSRVLEI